MLISEYIQAQYKEVLNRIKKYEKAQNFGSTKIYETTIHREER